ncbi:MAG: hypothetical protein IJ151_09100 [Bacteroidales bacterium]|nr:hypothetical protein [Bacteroidales bacterium]
MKKLLFIIGLLVSAVTGWAQDYTFTPADTVYLINGTPIPVHIKSIEEGPKDKDLGYQIFIHETMDRFAKDYWAQGTGAYSWASAKYREGWYGVQIQKIVFADGFELQFTNGEFNRELLLQAPRYTGSHGNILAEGVITLNPQETRTLIGEETYNLGYKVKKRQAKLGLVKTLVSAPVVLLCVWKKDEATKKTNLGQGSAAQLGMVSGMAVKCEKNALWNTMMPASLVTAVYGIVEMTASNIGVRNIAKDFKNYEVPSLSSFKTKTYVGAGVLVAGAALTYYGYKRIEDKGVYYDVYKTDSFAGGKEKTYKASRVGSKMSTAWLVPAAGALLVNFGLSELTYGINGLSGYKFLKNAGLERAEFHVGVTPDGIGLTMVF